MERKTNWIAVAVAVVAGFFLGFLWYGFLFQAPWMAGNGITVEGEKMFKNGAEMSTDMMKPMVFNLLGMAVSALLIDWLLGLAKAKTWMEGAKIGGAIGIIMFIGVVTGNMFAGNPMSLSLVDGSNSFCMYLLFGAILGGWPKK